MFSYLRYFSILGILLWVAAGSVLYTHLAPKESEKLTALAQAETDAAINSYRHSVWLRYPALRTQGKPPEDALAEFQRESKLFFQRHPFMKVTVFSPNMLQLYYSSGRDYVTYDGNARVPLFDLSALQMGEARIRLLKDVHLHQSDGVLPERTMTQAILPIFGALSPEALARCQEPHSATLKECTPEALVELYTDLTLRERTLFQPHHLQMGILGGAGLALLILLFITARRAESQISRAHETNLELTAAVAQAEAQSRDKSQFLAGVSHELRTPLNAIIGFSEILKQQAGPKINAECNTYLEDILSSGKHLLSLINDILDFSKAEAGKLQIDWAETDVTKVIRNSLRMVMPRAEAAQVTLIEDIPSEHFAVITDAKKLKQILLNLLSNAVKFTRAGGQVRCQIWEDVMNQQVIIQVSDTGIGIAPKDISRVMTPFGQVDSSLSRKYEGTGLGLPLAKKFLESMGGEFLLESELHVGTTVTISLPKKPSHLDLYPTPPASPQGS